jgi:hypothetical protein
LLLLTGWPSPLQAYFVLQWIFQRWPAEDQQAINWVLAHNSKVPAKGLQPPKVAQMDVQAITLSWCEAML